MGEKRPWGFLKIAPFGCLCLTLACGEIKPITDAAAQLEEESNATPKVESLLPPSETIFPHSKSWSDPVVHGAWTIQNDSDVCFQCHQKDLGGMGGAPACHSCHPLFPHPDGWVKKENHGSWVSANGKENCATQCHGTDFKGGLSKVSCESCHAIYPHMVTWTNPVEHGAVAKGDGKAICMNCHGNTSCYACHEKYPHETGWADPLKHGKDVTQNGTNGCATQCHGTNLKGGLSEVSCDNCHASYPHLDNWRDPTQHGTAALGNGKTSCGTANCHGSDFKGSLKAPSCFSCHADFPHTSSRWMTLKPTTSKTSDRDEGFHGDRFIRMQMSGKTGACAECHGANYDRLIGTGQCTNCHPNGVTHRNTTQTTWSSFTHGQYYTSFFNSISTNANCKDCHGGFVDFTDTQTKLSLESQSGCYRCHWAYPHRAYETPIWHEIWEPVVANNCGGMANSGHLLYLTGSSLFTDEQGRRPTSTNDPISIGAIKHTCGGSAGSCHFNGLRSYNTQATSALCGQYCHSSTMPSIPSRPPCP